MSSIKSTSLYTGTFSLNDTELTLADNIRNYSFIYILYGTGNNRYCMFFPSQAISSNNINTVSIGGYGLSVKTGNSTSKLIFSGLDRFPVREIAGYKLPL